MVCTCRFSQRFQGARFTTDGAVPRNNERAARLFGETANKPGYVGVEFAGALGDRRPLIGIAAVSAYLASPLGFRFCAVNVVGVHAPIVARNSCDCSRPLAAVALAHAH